MSGIDKLATRIRDWRVEQEKKTVGLGVAARLRSADRLGRLSIALAVLMVVLLPLDQATGAIGDFVDTMFRLGGKALALLFVLLPLIAAMVAGTFVWLARKLDPDVPWVPRLIPLGAWSVGFAALMLAT